MNPHFHNEFVVFAALFYSGELTDEEWALLQVHMAYCDACRNAFEQYQQIASGVIPAMASSAVAELPNFPEESSHSLQEAERRLMSQLDKRPVRHNQLFSSTSWGLLSTGVIAACVVAGLVYDSLQYMHRSHSQPTPSGSSVAAVQPVAHSPLTPRGNNDDGLLARDDQKISSLESQLSEAEKKSAQSKSALTDAQHLLRTEQDQQQQLIAQRNSLSQELAAAQENMQSLRSKLTAAESNAGQQTVRMTDLQAKVQFLNAALADVNASVDSKDKMLAFDKDLMLHDRDIRDVIGARNLYIADIYDTNSTGMTAKPFGRIFYTKDRSLVFYGFDLDSQAGIRQDVTFQVWGGSAERAPVSLGLFYQDDSHRRWILKCNDAIALAQLNSVFVTVEPPGGSSKPTGRRFLRAYLQIQPNHP